MINFKLILCSCEFDASTESFFSGVESEEWRRAVKLTDASVIGSPSPCSHFFYTDPTTVLFLPNEYNCFAMQ